MTCNRIMLSPPPTLTPGDTIPKGIELMQQYGMRELPVVDDEGRLLGMFTAFHLIKLLLPESATVAGGLTNISFMSDSLSEINDRVQETQAHPVGDNIDTENTLVVHPDTSLMETLLLLFQHRDHAAVVVDPSTNKVVGVVSINQVLTAIGNTKGNE